MSQTPPAPKSPSKPVPPPRPPPNQSAENEVSRRPPARRISLSSGSRGAVSPSSVSVHGRRFRIGPGEGVGLASCTPNIVTNTTQSYTAVGSSVAGASNASESGCDGGTRLVQARSPSRVRVMPDQFPLSTEADAAAAAATAVAEENGTIDRSAPVRWQNGEALGVAAVPVDVSCAQMRYTALTTASLLPMEERQRGRGGKRTLEGGSTHHSQALDSTLTSMPVRTASSSTPKSATLHSSSASTTTRTETESRSTSMRARPTDSSTQASSPTVSVSSPSPLYTARGARPTDAANRPLPSSSTTTSMEDVQHASAAAASCAPPGTFPAAPANPTEETTSQQQEEVVVEEEDSKPRVGLSCSDLSDSPTPPGAPGPPPPLPRRTADLIVHLSPPRRQCTLSPERPNAPPQCAAQLLTEAIAAGKPLTLSWLCSCSLSWSHSCSSLSKLTLCSGSSVSVVKRVEDRLQQHNRDHHPHLHPPSERRSHSAGAPPHTARAARVGEEDTTVHRGVNVVTEVTVKETTEDVPTSASRPQEPHSHIVASHHLSPPARKPAKKKKKEEKTAKKESEPASPLPHRSVRRASSFSEDTHSRHRPHHMHMHVHDNTITTSSSHNPNDNVPPAPPLPLPLPDPQWSLSMTPETSTALSTLSAFAGDERLLQQWLVFPAKNDFTPSPRQSPADVGLPATVPAATAGAVAKEEEGEEGAGRDRSFTVCSAANEADGMACEKKEKEEAGEVAVTVTVSPPPPRIPLGQANMMCPAPPPLPTSLPQPLTTQRTTADATAAAGVGGTHENQSPHHLQPPQQAPRGVDSGNSRLDARAAYNENGQPVASTSVVVRTHTCGRPRSASDNCRPSGDGAWAGHPLQEVQQREATPQHMFVKGEEKEEGEEKEMGNREHAHTTSPARCDVLQRTSAAAEAVGQRLSHQPHPPAASPTAEVAARHTPIATTTLRPQPSFSPSPAPPSCEAEGVAAEAAAAAAPPPFNSTQPYDSRRGRDSPRRRRSPPSEGSGPERLVFVPLYMVSSSPVTSSLGGAAAAAFAAGGGGTVNTSSSSGRGIAAQGRFSISGTMTSEAYAAAVANASRAAAMRTAVSAAAVVSGNSAAATAAVSAVGGSGRSTAMSPSTRSVRCTSPASESVLGAAPISFAPYPPPHAPTSGNASGRGPHSSTSGVGTPSGTVWGAAAVSGDNVMAAAHSVVPLPPSGHPSSGRGYSARSQRRGSDVAGGGVSAVVAASSSFSVAVDASPEASPSAAAAVLVDTAMEEENTERGPGIVSWVNPPMDTVAPLVVSSSAGPHTSPGPRSNSTATFIARTFGSATTASSPSFTPHGQPRPSRDTPPHAASARRLTANERSFIEDGALFTPNRVNAAMSGTTPSLHAVPATTPQTASGGTRFILTSPHTQSAQSESTVVTPSSRWPGVAPAPPPVLNRCGANTPPLTTSGSFITQVASGATGGAGLGALSGSRLHGDTPPTRLTLPAPSVVSDVSTPSLVLPQVRSRGTLTAPSLISAAITATTIPANGATSAPESPSRREERSGAK